MDHQIDSCLVLYFSLCDLCAFAPAVALPIGTVEVLVGGWLAGWQADGREGRGGGRVAWSHSEEAEEEETWCRCQASKNYCIGI